MILFLAALAFADPTVDALEDELVRNVTKLQLEDSSHPYFLSYQLLEEDEISITASLGSVVREWRSPSRVLGVGVRVGDPEVDSSHFGSRWDNHGFDSRRLGIEASPAEIRRAGWLLADAQYKTAVENLSGKLASRRGRTDMKRAPDFAPTEGVQFEAPARTLPSSDNLTQICRELSAIFLKHPDIGWSETSCSASAGRKVILDSSDTRVSMPTRNATVHAAGSIRAEDGTYAWDGAGWIVGAVDDLPGLEVMKAATEEAAQRLEAWAAAPVLEDEYAGPVLFTGDAAVALFAQLLLPALSGTPEMDELGFSGDVEPGKDPLRLKRRILPLGYRVVDDPLANPALPSSFTHDDAGAEAQRVEVIEDGLVRNLLMSHIPNKDVGETNGHARGGIGEELTGQPSNVTVTPDREVSWKKLVKQGLALAATYELDHILLVRSLKDEELEGEGLPGFFSMIIMGGGDEESDLMAPLDVVRLYKDGREERVRGLEVGGADLRTLRDIVAAGAENTKIFYYSTGDGYGDESVPVTVTAPDVLIGEMVFVPREGTSPEAPRLQSPLQAGN